MTIKQIQTEAKLQQKELETIVQKTIEQAKLHVDDVEVSINKATGINVSTRQGETENIEFNSDGGLSITVYQDKRVGHASTNDLSPDAITKTIEMAKNIMQYTSPDLYSGLGEVETMAFNPPDLDLFYPSDLNIDHAILQAKKAELTALKHPKITKSDGAYFASQYGIYVYGNSQNMLQGYAASNHSLSCSVIGEQNGNMERNYAYTSSRDMNLLSSPELIGQEAAQKTIDHLGARQIATMQTPVLFSANVAVGLIGHLVNAISGSSIYRKSSFLLDAIDTRIFPDWLSIYENPHILKGNASSPFDNEGTRTCKRYIVENGVLQTYLLSNYSARKLGLSTTGHAGGIHNWLVAATHDDSDFNAMINQLYKGLVITSLMGQGVNHVTGDYSRGASGFWVENGKIQYPVNEITIAGNLNEMYKNIVAVGNDVENRTAIQSGSILVDNMSVAGK